MYLYIYCYCTKLHNHEHRGSVASNIFGRKPESHYLVLEVEDGADAGQLHQELALLPPKHCQYLADPVSDQPDPSLRKPDPNFLFKKTVFRIQNQIVDYYY